MRRRNNVISIVVTLSLLLVLNLNLKLANAQEFDENKNDNLEFIEGFLEQVDSNDKKGDENSTDITQETEGNDQNSTDTTQEAEGNGQNGTDTTQEMEDNGQNGTDTTQETEGNDQNGTDTTQEMEDNGQNSTDTTQETEGNDENGTDTTQETEGNCEDDIETIQELESNGDDTDDEIRITIEYETLHFSYEADKIVWDNESNSYKVILKDEEKQEKKIKIINNSSSRTIMVAPFLNNTGIDKEEGVSGQVLLSRANSPLWGMSDFGTARIVNDVYELPSILDFGEIDELSLEVFGVSFKPDVDNLNEQLADISLRFEDVTDIVRDTDGEMNEALFNVIEGLYY